jgi:hypothetical protein
VRLPSGTVGWLPSASLSISGTLAAPAGATPQSYVITGRQALDAVRQPALPEGPGHMATPSAVATVSPGSVLPVRGVLPRYFDGKPGTSWIEVGLPDGGSGWLYQQDEVLQTDMRYLLPPPRAAESPWLAPLPSGHTLLGAYGEELGTAQWPLRGSTRVRGSAGDRVQAVAGGEIIFAGYSVRWGRYYVVVRHNGAWDGWQTAYLGLDPAGLRRLHIAAGLTVRGGQTLGYLAQDEGQPANLLFVVQTPDGTPIESQNVLQWP